MVEAQQRAMEMEKHELEVVAMKRCVILDITTLLEKGIEIPDPEQFMWT
jgi:hypothetical protein